MARGGVSSRPDAWAHPAGRRRKCAAEPLLGQGWACGRITQDRKMQREGRGTPDAPEFHFEIAHKSVPGPGPARRRCRR